jgi:osmotically-inducible protein OsmY
MNNDSALKEAVLAELAWEPSVTAAHIGVTARDGVVTLSGHVLAYYEKHAAEAAARRVKGVKAVAEEIEVKLPMGLIRDDGDIAAAAVSRLAWDASIPENAIKVTVEKGWVKLTGKVNWHFERDAAAKDVRSLHGVIGVTNDIEIKSGVNPAHISSDITKALHRSWFDESHVKVTAEGGKVTLTGRVDSWSDRKLAGATAWAAPGATSVENDLVIA